MRRACILMVLAGLLLAGRPAFAAEAALSPVDAIRAGKNIAAAIQDLVKQGQASVAPMAGLLHEKDVTPRLVAALVLAKLADTLKSPELIQALDMARKDSSPGVRYWAILGTLKTRAAGADVSDVLKPLLVPKENAVLRNIAIQEAVTRKVADLAPPLMKLLQAEAKKYDSTRQRILTQPLKTVEELVRDRVGGADTSSVQMQEWVHQLEAFYRQELANASTQTAVAIKPSDLNARELTNLSDKFCADPIVMNVRLLGVSLEKITGQDWGFAKAAPWDYTASIDRAMGWYKQQGGTLTEEE